MKTILVTGGLGFIGSHTSVLLLQNNYNIIIVDNLSNSKIEVKNKISQITNKDFIFIKLDLLDKIKLETQVFEKHDIFAVIHFAGLKSVNESIDNPILYYQNNIISTLNLLDLMKKYNCKNIIFSSSATIYGKPDILPITENESEKPINVYGRTKYFIEQILKDIYRDDWNIIILRYFNPIGGHQSGLLQDNPNNIPNNLLPCIINVVLKKREYLNIYGNDYKTQDGTCIRDYIHIMDLSNAHLSSLFKIEEGKSIFKIYNVGTGKGYSVLEIINAINKYLKSNLPVIFAERRKGDVDVVYADNKLIRKELNWIPEHSLDMMCFDSLRSYGLI